jgi:hypothetical protein
MSRAQAKRTIRGRELQQQMQQRGILVKAVSMSGRAEEAGLAYKNISDVVESVERAGITKKVLELRPIGNIKGELILPPSRCGDGPSEEPPVSCPLSEFVFFRRHGWWGRRYR